MFSSPAIVDDVVFMGSNSGHVYALHDSSASLLHAPKSYTPLFIIIGAVAAFVIVVSVVFLVFKKRLKNKPTSLPDRQFG